MRYSQKRWLKALSKNTVAGYAMQSRERYTHECVARAVTAVVEFYEREWADFFARAELKNTFTNEPIKCKADFEDWYTRMQDEKKTTTFTKKGLHIERMTEREKNQG